MVDREPKPTKDARLEDLEPQADPKGGIICVCIGLKAPAPAPGSPVATNPSNDK